MIATGPAAAVPPIGGLADTPFWTDHEAIEVEQLPDSITVLGGGAIGLELAQVFARFGVAVADTEAQDRRLPLEEPEAAHALAEAFTADGIHLHVGVTARAVTYDRQRFSIALSDGTALGSDRLLVATGRKIELEPLGVAATGSTTRLGRRWSTSTSASPTESGPSVT